MKVRNCFAVVLLMLVCLTLAACVNAGSVKQSEKPTNGQTAQTGQTAQAEQTAETEQSKELKEISAIVLDNKDLLERGVEEIDALDKNVTGLEFNEDQLIAAVNNYKLEEIMEYKPIENAVLRDVLKIEGIGQITIARSSIEFSYTGEGSGSASTYYGFYYAELDEPAKRTYDDLTPKGKGWTYTEDTGTVYYTEKIADHWYYSEVRY